MKKYMAILPWIPSSVSVIRKLLTNKKFEMSALAAFNKKITNMKQGKEIVVEEDEIGSCPIVGHIDTENTEYSNDLTVLHD